MLLLLHVNDPDGNRTRVTAVKGRCLNRLTTGPYVVTAIAVTVDYNIILLGRMQEVFYFFITFFIRLFRSAFFFLFRIFSLFPHILFLIIFIFQEVYHGKQYGSRL